jgi:hypothetical protein
MWWWPMRLVLLGSLQLIGGVVRIPQLLAGQARVSNGLQNESIIMKRNEFTMILLLWDIQRRLPCKSERIGDKASGETVAGAGE